MQGRVRYTPCIRLDNTPDSGLIGRVRSRGVEPEVLVVQQGVALVKASFSNSLTLFNLV